MPDRQQVREQSRNISSSNPADKPGHKTELSTVTIEGCELLTRPDELKHMAQHHIDAQGDPTIVDHVEDNGSTMVYYFTTKGIAVGLARRIEDAFKHHRPIVKILTPQDHRFERVVVTLQTPSAAL